MKTESRLVIAKDWWGRKNGDLMPMDIGFLLRVMEVF